jgi:hypothetical protein
VRPQKGGDPPPGRSPKELDPCPLSRASVHPSPERTWTGAPCTHNVPAEAHPRGYVEKPLLIGETDCTGLWHKLADDEVKRLTRHLPPSNQAVARTVVLDCTAGGRYLWSQERLGRRAGVRRETTNRALRRLSGDLGLIDKPKKQRHYNAPKTLTLARWVLDRIWKAVLRALDRVRRWMLPGLGHTRKAKPSVEVSHGPGGLLSRDEFLSRFPERRRYAGGWMVRCPAHRDRTPSLSVSEGRRGQLLLYCHAGCSHAEVRAACGLPPPRKVPVTLRAAGPLPPTALEEFQAALRDPAVEVLTEIDHKSGDLIYETVDRPGPVPWDIPAKVGS